MVEIPLVRDVREKNAESAKRNREAIRAAGVFCVNLIGSPGSGKTTLLERTAAALEGDLAVGVLAGDLTTTRDAERLGRFTPHVVQINTGKGCHLTADQVRLGLSSIPLHEIDILFVENVGNLICPVGFDLGQDATVGVMSVPEGDDKPAKHPWLVLEAQLLLLTKVDLLPFVPFDLDRFRADLASVRQDVPLIPLAATTGEGLGEWLAWLREQSRA